MLRNILRCVLFAVSVTWTFWCQISVWSVNFRFKIFFSLNENHKFEQNKVKAPTLWWTEHYFSMGFDEIQLKFLHEINTSQVLNEMHHIYQKVVKISFLLCFRSSEASLKMFRFCQANTFPFHTTCAYGKVKRTHK